MYNPDWKVHAQTDNRSSTENVGFASLRRALTLQLNTVSIQNKKLIWHCLALFQKIPDKLKIIIRHVYI